MFQPIKKVFVGVVALAALALGGSAIAGAASSSSSSGTSPSGTSTTQTRPAMPAHGSASHEDAEKPVTGDAATKAQDAAVKSVGSGTAGDVTTDFTGDGYEVTVTKSDGTKVEVHLDNSFNVIQGGPGGHRGGCDGDGHGGPPPGGAAPQSGTSSGTSSNAPTTSSSI
jgi:hypothetical protein